MKKEKKDRDFLQKAYYKGGTDALRKFIKDNLVYPEKALDNKIEGRVSLQLRITHLGNVREVKVISGIGYGCDEEAIRLAKMMHFEVASHYRKRVEFGKKINIHFKLPKKKIKAKQQFKYQLIEEKNKDQNKSKSGYSYVIRF